MVLTNVPLGAKLTDFDSNGADKCTISDSTYLLVMTIKTCTKVNIGLNVLRKRPDGYHDL